MNLTQTERSRILDTIVDDLVNTPNYVFLSKFTTWEEGDDKLTDYSDKNSNDIRSEIFVGKRVSASNVKRMFRRVNWVSGTVYDIYQSDVDMATKDFYVITASARVYKCIYNNNGKPSTVSPSLISTTPFTTADGYVWKYMFSVASGVMNDFATITHFPFSSDPTVEEAAVDGTIDAIRINGSGNNWSIYESSSIVTRLTPRLFQIASTASTVNSYYVDSGFYIADGSGVGFVSKIVTSHSNSLGNYVTLDTDAPSGVDFGSTYLISPAVTIEGDGTGAKAFTTVNTATGVIEYITMANSGSGYSWATASVTSNVGTSNTAVSVTPMIAPRYGHGKDPKRELFSEDIMVSVRFEPEDAPLTNFRAAGLLRAPYDNAGSPFSDASFDQFMTANSTYYVGTNTPPSAGETIEGQISAATGKIITSNSSYLVVGSIVGEFTDEIAVSSGESGSVVTIEPINSPQINTLSGELSFFKHYGSIGRSNNSSERIRLMIGS